MDFLKRIANPVLVLVLICTFIYVYFVYLRGGDPNSLTVTSPPAETEKAQTETENVQAETEKAQTENAQMDNIQEVAPPEVPNNVALVEPVVRQEVPINQLNQPNFVEPPNQLRGPQGNQDIILPTQPNQNVPLQPIAVPDRALIEGHWIGLEVIPLTAVIAKANSIPQDVAGVLIDEVTLLAAEAGFYAGDVIVAVNRKKVNDLKSFQQATGDMAQSNRASVLVYSDGKYKEVVVFSTEMLGIAQMEGAPMILATDRSPHGYYGPCDRCHAISRTPLNSNQLAKDQGDSLKKIAPNIRMGTPPPHRNRGTCTKCHVVL